MKKTERAVTDQPATRRPLRNTHERAHTHTQRRTGETKRKRSPWKESGSKKKKRPLKLTCFPGCSSFLIVEPLFFVFGFVLSTFLNSLLSAVSRASVCALGSCTPQAPVSKSQADTHITHTFLSLAPAIGTTSVSLGSVNLETTSVRDRCKKKKKEDSHTKEPTQNSEPRICTRA